MNPFNIAFSDRESIIRKKAESVLGSKQLADDWMTKPALGLNRKCPLDMLGSLYDFYSALEFLERMERGVY
jgi:uncharacterized protein (DUF2384 family)